MAGARTMAKVARDFLANSALAGVLDSARYRLFVAQAAVVSVENVKALVLGWHGGVWVWNWTKRETERYLLI